MSEPPVDTCPHSRLPRGYLPEGGSTSPKVGLPPSHFRDETMQIWEDEYLGHPAMGHTIHT